MFGLLFLVLLMVFGRRSARKCLERRSFVKRLMKITFTRFSWTETEKCSHRALTMVKWLWHGDKKKNDIFSTSTLVFLHFFFFFPVCFRFSSTFDFGWQMMMLGIVACKAQQKHTKNRWPTVWISCGCCCTRRPLYVAALRFAL